MRIPFETLHATFRRVLLKHHFSEERADLCARLFTEASCDGVASHGLNRFPRFIEYIEKGYVDPQAEAEPVLRLGSIEQWDGNQGPGNLNAHAAMSRTIELAQVHGMGLVALRHTNHWMRGGAYGWQAANAGCIGVCWTNTIPNMPPWGGKKNVLGNNPLIIAIPRPEGHLVLDMALSQFSFGKVESYLRKGETLPHDGGFDKQGKVTRDPAAITESMMGLPIGYWKGAGLSLMLDLLAALLSGGLSSVQVGELGVERQASQVFLAIDLTQLATPVGVEALTDTVLTALHDAGATSGDVRYPGERTLATRRENLEKGIPVDEGYWNQVLGM